MSLGHGQFGLLDRLRTYADLVSDNGASRKPYFDLCLGFVFAKARFSFWGGSFTYAATITAEEVTRGGVVRPIVGIEVQAPTVGLSKVFALKRVDGPALLQAGTWSYDDTMSAGGTSENLYIWMPDNSDPDDSTVVAHLQFSFGTESAVHPLFGPERWDYDGEFELSGWASSSVFVTITRDTVNPASGLSSGYVSGAGVSSSVVSGPLFFVNAAQGAMYRFSGYYRTPVVPDPFITYRISVGTAGGGGIYLLNDGRNTTTSASGFDVRPTYGEWRRFVFDFVWAGAATTLNVVFGLWNSSGSSQPGSMNVDRFSVKRILRFMRYDAGLDASSIPDLTVQAKSIHFGGTTIGIGNVRLLSGDDTSLNEVFAGLLPFHKPARVWMGGQFQNGEEILADDWRGVFAAITGKPTYDATGVGIELTNAFDLARAKANPTRYLSNAAENPNMNKGRENEAKALVFGGTDEFIFDPVRVDITGNGYGVYQYLDQTIPLAENIDVRLPPNGYFMLKTYPNKALADLDENGRELSIAIVSNTAANPSVVTTAEDHGLTTGDTVDIMGVITSNPTINGARVVTATGATTFTVAVNVTTPGTGGKFINRADYSITAGAGANNTKLTILRDVRNMFYDKAGNPDGLNASFDWNIGGATLTILFSTIGPPSKVARYLGRLMNAVSGTADITVTYSETTHKFTVAKGAGVLQLIMIGDPVVADRAHKQSWRLLGFATTANRTGALTYTADNPVFTSPEEDHHIRMTGSGYKDDSTGTVTGTASQVLEYAADVYAWILMKVLNVPPQRVNVAEFAIARAAQFSAFEKLFVVIDRGAAMEFLDVLSQIGLMTVWIDGDGVFRCRRYTEGVTDGVRDFYDHDIETMTMWLDESAVFREVRLQGDWHPGLGKFRTYMTGVTAVEARAVPVKHGTEEVLDIGAFLAKATITGGVCLLGEEFARMIYRVPRMVEFSSMGRLADMAIGQKVRITYTGPEVIDTTGKLNAILFRITGLRHNFFGASVCTAVEDLQWLTVGGGGGIDRS